MNFCRIHADFTLEVTREMFGKTARAIPGYNAGGITREISENTATGFPDRLYWENRW